MAVEVIHCVLSCRLDSQLVEGSRGRRGKMIVLGFHGGVTVGQHEATVALAINGRIVAACEEDRYLRIKSAHGYLPYYAIKACPKMENLRREDVDLVVTPGVTSEFFVERI